MQSVNKSEIQHPSALHYNIDHNFFSSFLDKYMKYTSGLYLSKQEDLNTASTQMLDFLIDSSSISDDSRILEVGSGWGSLLKRITDKEIDCVYEGISPSESQNQYIRSLGFPNSTIFDATLEGKDLEKGKYDAIFLIGSFCHLHKKEQMLDKLKRSLSKGGRIVIEDTFFITDSMFHKHRNDPRTEFLQKQVFGFAEIQSLSTFFNCIDRVNLRLKSSVDLTDSYRMTIETWIERIECQDNISKDLTETFLNFLRIALAGLNYTISNHVIVLEQATNE